MGLCARRHTAFGFICEVVQLWLAIFNQEISLHPSPNPMSPFLKIVARVHSACGADLAIEAALKKSCEIEVLAFRTSSVVLDE